MEFVVQMLPGVVLVGVLFVAYLVAKHGWAWTVNWFKTRAATTEAAAKAERDKLIADIKAELAKAPAPAAPPAVPVVQV